MPRWAAGQKKIKKHQKRVITIADKNQSVGGREETSDRKAPKENIRSVAQAKEGVEDEEKKEGQGGSQTS